GVKGNMAELLRFARAPYPLPLGALRGRRSLLALDNLVAAVDTVLAAPGRLRRPLLVADPAALTIPEMIAALRRRPRPPPRPDPGAEVLAQNGVGRGGPHRDLPTARGLAGGGPRRAPTPRLGAAGRDGGCAGGARAKLERVPVGLIQHSGPTRVTRG